MKTASDIIDTLGGLTAVSRATGIRLTTVSSWKAVNFIPEWRQPKLLALAKKLGTPITPADFPPVEARLSRSQAAA